MRSCWSACCGVFFFEKSGIYGSGCMRARGLGELCRAKRGRWSHGNLLDYFVEDRLDKLWISCAIERFYGKILLMKMLMSV